MRRSVNPILFVLPVLSFWAATALAAPGCPEIQQFLKGSATGVLCFHSDDLRTNNAVTTPANNSITTFADGTPLPGLLAGFGSFTPITDRGVISNGPTPTADPVPGIQVEGWLAGDPTNQARFVLRFPDDWNGKLVVAGASGTRSEYNGDFAWSDYVLPEGLRVRLAEQRRAELLPSISFGRSADLQPTTRCRVNPPAERHPSRSGCISTTTTRRNRSRSGRSTCCTPPSLRKAR